MERREFINMVGLASLSFLLPKSNALFGQQAAGKTNIIFIMADDLGYHDLGCYGQEKIQTPHIDKLAEEGMRFTQCYAGSSVCAPSRSVLMTGQHTGHTTIRGNFARVGGKLVLDNGSPQRRLPLNAEDVTIAEVLKDAGYATGITGKWGIGESQTPGIPNKQGFDDWFGYLNQRRAHSYYPMYLWRNQEKVFLKQNQNGQEGQYTHDLFTEWALNFVNTHADEPFFLYLPYMLPHAEYKIPDLGPYEDEDWSDDAKVHAAMITRMDRDIGRLMSLLQELNIDQNTIVFFCSDNGAAETWEGVFDSAAPFRGHKGDLYEGGIRTPMIVRQPGVVPAGSESDIQWYFPDVLPTLADIAGAEAPENIDGVSVWPVLQGKQDDLSERYLYWESYRYGDFQQAARWKQWKAIRNNVDEPLELYDLSKDQAETTNLADKHPQIVRKIDQFMANAHVPSEHYPIFRE